MELGSALWKANTLPTVCHLALLSLLTGSSHSSLEDRCAPGLVSWAMGVGREAPWEAVRRVWMLL